MKDKYQAHFFMFSMRFVIVPIWYRKNNFKISHGSILVKCEQHRQQMPPQGGPDTHDDPHKTGAARKAAQALYVQKTILESIKSFSISDWNKISIL